MRKLLIVCCMLCALGLQAQTLKKVSEAQAKAMVEQINQTAAAIKTLACDFTQVKSLHFLNDKMTSEGKMYYDGSGKLRWEYTSPYSYTFILNGQQVYIKSAKSTHTIDIRQSKLFQSIAQVMMNSVTGKSLTSGSDFTTVLYTQGSAWVAELTPKKKEMKQMFKTIRLNFDSTRQMVSQVEMTEQSGDQTVITLKHVKTNGKMEANLFVGR